MNKIVFCMAVSMLLAACSNDSGKSSACKPNATITSKSTMTEKAEPMTPEKTLLIKAKSVVREQSDNVITLKSGSQITFKSDDTGAAANEGDDQGTDTVIDFARQTVASDGQTISFALNPELTAQDEKKITVYSIDEASAKKSIMSFEAKDSAVNGFRICEATKFKGQFKYNVEESTVESVTDIEVQIQYTAEELAKIEVEAAKQKLEAQAK